MICCCGCNWDYAGALVNIRRPIPCQEYFSLEPFTKRERNDQTIYYLSVIRSNNSLHGLIEVFHNISERYKALRRNTKPASDVSIMKLISQIILLDYFGTGTNRKLFNDVVKKILVCSVNECTLSESLVDGWNYEKLPWFPQAVRVNAKILQMANIILLELVIKPLIRDFYYPLKTRKANEIRYFPVNSWKSFEDKVMNFLLQEGYLVYNTRCDKYQRSISEGVMPEIVRGTLKVIPKGDINVFKEYRPLVLHKTCKDSRYYRQCENYSKDIYKIARNLSFVKTGSVYQLWESFLKKIGGVSLYAAKLDVTDAFGSIDIEKLCSIISNLNIQLKEKAFLKRHIKNQFVTFKKINGQPLVFQWKKGLLQGDKLSPSLCELYMANLEIEHLQLFNSDTCIIHRTVDDYFICSTCHNEVCNFKEAICQIHQINVTKMQTSAVSELRGNIEYAGHVFCLQTKTVKGFFNFEGNKAPIAYKFKFWNINRPILKLDRFLLWVLHPNFCNAYFDKLQLNLVFNDVHTVLRNFFDSMIFVSFKFVLALMARNKIKENTACIISVIRKIVYKFARVAMRRLTKYCEKYNPLNLSNFMRVGFRAFKLVLKKKGQEYSDILKDKNFRYFGLIVPNEKIDFNYFRKIPECFSGIILQRKPFTQVRKSKNKKM